MSEIRRAGESVVEASDSPTASAAGGKQHAQLPWRVERIEERKTGWDVLSIVSGDGCSIANLVMSLIDNERATARYLVTACNVFPELVAALEWVLPIAEAYLATAPSHPDNAKLETARAVLAKAEAK